MANSIPGIGGSSSSSQVDLLETSSASKPGVQVASSSTGELASPQQANDATDLSNLGKFIATAVKSAGARSSIRPDVVASFKAQLAAGTYHPDPNEVAARVAAALKP